MKAREFEMGSRVEKAQQAYLILIGMAHNRQITTYAGIAHLMGYENTTGFNYVGQLLWPVAAWCKHRKLPILPAIVVNKKGGFAASDGIYGGPERWAAELQRVFNHKWYSIYGPNEEELVEALDWAKVSFTFEG